MAFLKPSEKAAKMLDSIGLSAEKVRRAIREDGMIATFENLRNTLDKNGIALTDVIGRVEGLNAVLQLTGDKLAPTNDVLKQVANSAGMVDEAFDVVSQTSAFQFNQALANLSSTGIEVGSKVLPALVDVLGSVNEVLSDLEPSTISWGIALAGALVVPPGSTAFNFGKDCPSNGEV